MVEAIDDLLGEHEYQEIVDLSMRVDFVLATVAPSMSISRRICKQSGLKSRRQRLRDKGMLTMKEMARRIRART